jgi:hypothetical protein
MLSAFSQWKRWPSYVLKYRLVLLVRSEDYVLVDHRSQPVLCAMFEDPQPNLDCKHLLARLLVQHGANDGPLPTHKTAITVLRNVLAKGLDPVPLLGLLHLMLKNSFLTNPDLVAELVPLLVQILNSPSNCESVAALVVQDLIGFIKTEDLMISEGMAEALARTLCQRPCLCAASALTSLCRRSSARRRVVGLLPHFMPSLFAALDLDTAARLAIRFVGDAGDRRVVWHCLSGLAGSLYESLEDKTVKALVRGLSADPEAAAHMVRHKVHNRLRII